MGTQIICDKKPKGIDITSNHEIHNPSFLYSIPTSKQTQVVLCFKLRDPFTNLKVNCIIVYVEAF